MAEAKMRETGASVTDFIEAIDHDRKKAEAYTLLDIFTEVTGYEAKMWGPSIIGFGKYHYTYASGREGDAPLVGFSPRKAKVSLYLDYEGEERDVYLAKLGKHAASKACIYVNKLADIDLDVLEALIQHSLEKYKQLYPDSVE